MCTHTAGSTDRISGSCSRGNELLALGASTIRSCILSLSPNHRFSEPQLIDRAGRRHADSRVCQHSFRNKRHV